MRWIRVLLQLIHSSHHPGAISVAFVSAVVRHMANKCHFPGMSALITAVRLLLGIQSRQFPGVQRNKYKAEETSNSVWLDLRQNTNTPVGFRQLCFTTTARSIHFYHSGYKDDERDAKKRTNPNVSRSADTLQISPPLYLDTKTAKIGNGVFCIYIGAEN